MFTRNLFALIIALLLSTAIQAQNLTIGDSTSRWKFGFNTGFAFQKADVRSSGGFGVGATLEWALIQNSYTTFGLSLRGRWLYSETNGKDFKKSTGLANNPALNGQNNPNANYNAFPGYVYMNYRTKANDLSLELMLIANRLRQKGILLYAFGGAGFVPYRTYYDQLDANGNAYDYSKITGTSKTDVLKQLDALRDKNYESVADRRPPTWIFSPSGGAGIGFYVTPYTVLGFEHKTTFPTTDLFDGQRWNDQNKRTGQNDIHHYTSFYFRSDLGGGRGKVRSARYNQNNYTTVDSKPEIYVNSPTTTATNSCDAAIRLTIKHVESKSGIIVKQNGVLLDASLYAFEGATGKFVLNLTLQQSSTFTITASNASGSRTAYINYNCTPGHEYTTQAPPIITVTSPYNSPYTSPDCNANVTAQISNVTGKENIEVRQNGMLVNPNSFNFNVASKTLTLSTPISGTSTTISIFAVNNAGTGSASVSFNCTKYTPPPTPVTPKPVIIINKPSTTSSVSQDCMAEINATISNLDSKYNLEVRQNGLVISSSSYYYNIVTDQFNLRVPISGINNFTITAVNNTGTATTNLSIKCEPLKVPVPVIPAPSVTITNPAVNPYISSDCIANISAVILNVSTANNIEVRQNGQILSGTNYTYDKYSGIFQLTSNITSITTYTITAVNESGKASKDITVKCEPQQQQQVLLKPVISVVSPLQNPFETADCKAGINAYILNIEGKQNLEVRQNGQIISSGLYSYDVVTKTFSLNTNISGVTVFTITAANASGVASSTVNFKCESVNANVPVVQKPEILINSPIQNPYTSTDCKAAILASITNINGKENIEVRQNGQVVPASSYTYDPASKFLNLNMGMNGITVFTITAANAAGVANFTLTIKCPPQTIPQPVVASPVITIKTPGQNPYISPDCNALISAEIKNIESENNIEVRQNGLIVSSALYQFDPASKLFNLNTNIHEVTIFTITAANAGGSTSSIVTIKCQPVINTTPVVQKPVITINTPSQNPFVSEDCKASINATISNIDSENNIEVRQNGQILNSGLYTFDPASKLLVINTIIKEVTVFTITAANAAGNATGSVTIKCQPKTTTTPVIQKPAIIITTPSENPYTSQDCKVDIKGTISNIDSENNIDVRQNGQVVSSALYHFDPASKSFELITTIDQLSIFTISAANAAGSTSYVITIKCQPKSEQTEEVKKPVITVTSPAQSIYTSEDCKAAITATIENITNESNLDVRQNGTVVSSALYKFDPASRIFTLNTDIKGLTVFSITAVNSTGSSSTVLTIKCQPKADEQPVVLKPTVTINSPAQSPYTSVDCKASITATIKNIDSKDNIEVRQNGQIITSDKYTFDASGKFTLNIPIENQVIFTITAANSSGSSYATVTISCKKEEPTTPIEEEKVTICHLPPGNPENGQTLTIPKSALKAHLDHGDVMGTCDVYYKSKADEKAKQQAEQDRIQKEADEKAKQQAIQDSIQRAANEPKITICHLPPGNPGNSQTLTIPKSALKAHLDHGDVIGTCDEYNKTKADEKAKQQAIQDSIQRAANEPKITICHLPPGNPGNSQTLTIPKSALKAHLDHGDVIGTCDEYNKTKADEKAKQQAEQDRIQKEADEKARQQAEQDRLQKEADDKNKQQNNNTGGQINFNINNGTVVPTQCFNATVTVVGCALKEGGVGMDYPVIMQVKFGGNTVDPFGTYNGYNKISDVNDHIVHNWNSPQPIAPNTAISVKAKSYNPKTSSLLYERNSASNDPFVKVLRNGDAVPTVKGYAGQADAKSFLQSYIVNGKIQLNANQAIYLFELGTNSTTSTSCDFQDCVVLVTLSPADCSGTGSNTQSPTNPNSTQQTEQQRLQKEADDKAKQAEQLRIQQEADAKAKQQAEQQRLQKEADDKAKQADQLRIQQEADAKAKQQAEQQRLQKEADDKAKQAEQDRIQKEAEANEEKITICHLPPGNPGNGQTLTIPKSALKAHLDHGDVIGTCDDYNKQKGQKEADDKAKQAEQDRIQKENEEKIRQQAEQQQRLQKEADEKAKQQLEQDRIQKEADANEEKITICHLPPGNPGNGQTLTIPKSALKAHLDHGDVIGTCDDYNKQKGQKEADDKAKQAEQDRIQRENDEKVRQQNEQLRIQKEADDKAKQQRDEQDRIQRENDEKVRQQNEQLRIQKEADDKAKQQQDEQDRIQRENDEKVRQQNEQLRIQKEADDKAKQQQDEQDRIQRENDEKIRQQAEQQRIQREADEKARQQQAEQDRIQRENDDRIRQQAEQDRIQKDADEKARQQQAEQDRIQRENDERVRQQAEQQRIQKEADDKARQQAEQDRLKKLADEKARQQAEQQRLQKEADEKARQQAEQERIRKEQEDNNKQQDNNDNKGGGDNGNGNGDRNNDNKDKGN